MFNNKVIRKAKHANSWYSGDATELGEQFEKFFSHPILKEKYESLSKRV